MASIPFISKKYVIFAGVPLRKNSYKVNSGKYFITIKTELSILPAEPSIGQHWEVAGNRNIEHVEQGDYIMQQHVYDSPEHVVCTLPEDGEQLVKFIAKEKDFTGIGEVKARELWRLLGKQFHPILRLYKEESRERLRNVLSDDSINALFIGYAKYKNLSYCNWMTEHKIPAPVQQKLLKFHKEESIKAIQVNPYLLAAFGMPFKTVDEIAQSKFQMAQSDDRRLSTALEMSIQKEVEKGHTYTTREHIRPYLRTLLNDKELVNQAFKAGYDKAQYVLDADTYHPTAQFLMEHVVVKRLMKLSKQKNLYNDETETAYCSAARELPYELVGKQPQAVLATLDNAVSCITGGAGTGKTTVLRTALSAYHQLGFEIHAVALSGRAAMRLRESIGFATFTIAACLGGEPIEPSAKHPNHLLVIDESSMIDLPTMFRLVNHLHPSVRIIFTGDPDQLPPIGCGKVLSDIVESKAIVNTMLDIVKRQRGSTGIPEYSKLINQGIVPKDLTSGNIHFHETPRGDMVEKCTELYCQSPYNSRVISSTKALVADINKLTQILHNPNGKVLSFEMHGELFFQNLRLGDAIFFTQNNYEKEIQNGSLGTLISVEPTKDSYGVVKLDTGLKVEVTQAVLDCMELGYCITLHKAQGSQFPRIIIALRHGMIVDRAWLYTAITRAESEIHIVGSAQEFANITKSPSNSHNRRSYLKTMLVNGIIKGAALDAKPAPQDT